VTPVPPDGVVGEFEPQPTAKPISPRGCPIKFILISRADQQSVAHRGMNYISAISAQNPDP
jgi:hypothetical protein